MTKQDVEKKVEEVLSKAYARRLIPDETGGYLATIQEFPGCIADGDTADEALNNLNAAASSWVKVALSTGYEFREPIDFDGYSGKIALRIPRGLHKQAAELAEQEGTSINQLLVSAIAQYVGGSQAYSKLSASMLLEIRRVMTDGLVSFYRKSPWMLSIVFPESNKQYVASTTIEGQLIEKTFQLGVTR